MLCLAEANKSCVVFRRLVICCTWNDVLDVKHAAARKCLMFEADGVADRLGGREDLSTVLQTSPESEVLHCTTQRPT